MSSPELALALAQRLNEVMPLGFAVHAIDVDLVVLHEGDELGRSGAPGIMETAEAINHPEENLETAVRASLSGVQDYIAEATTQPWPASSGRQPNPDARVTSGQVEMWFGDESNPAVALRPIHLT